jgi:hypothetical protein
VAGEVQGEERNSQILKKVDIMEDERVEKGGGERERLERGMTEIEKIISQTFSGTLVILCPIATRCPQFSIYGRH